MVDHLYALNTLVNQLVFIYINIREDYTCITLLCYFLVSWDNVIVEIGRATQSMLKFEDVVASLLS